MGQNTGSNGIATLGNLVATTPSPVPAGEIATLSNLVGGSGYNNFPPTYNVTLTGGSGTGATATVTAASGTGTITSVTIVNPGTGYAVGDVLGVSGAGSNGSGFSIHVASLVPGNVTGTVTGVSLTGGSGTGATATLTVNAGTVTAVKLTNVGSGYAVNDSLSGTSSGVGSFTIAVTKVNGVAASQNGVYIVTQAGNTSSGVGPIATVNTTAGGTGYISATYANVPLSGGTGKGATATVTVAGNGPINSIGTVVSGSGYTQYYGEVSGVALTGGSGSGAAATLLVQGGKVLSVQLTNPGTGYAAGDILSASGLAGGTGFAVSVASILGSVTNVVLVNAGTGYTVNDTLSLNAAFVGGVGSGFAGTVATVVPSSWCLMRAGDAAVGSEMPGLAVWVTNGQNNGGKIFVCNTFNPVVLDTTALTFVNISTL